MMKRFFIVFCCVGCVVVQTLLKYDVIAESVSHPQTQSDAAPRSHIDITT